MVDTNNYKLGSGLWRQPNNNAADEFYKFSEDYDIEYYKSLYVSGGGGLFSGNDGKRIAEKIMNALSNRWPFSMVRMSDGEGCLLLNSSLYPHLSVYVLSKISHMHFGDDEVVNNYAAEFREMMIDSVSNADVVCVPEMDAIDRGFNIEAELADVRAIVGNRCSAAFVGERFTENVVYASAWTNRHLLSRYPEILSNLPRLGLVCSYPELPQILKSTYSISEIDYYQIPKQAVFEDSSKRRDSKFYPNIFNKLINMLSVKYEGMLFLVAAGLLSKKLCAEIKARGGIAIDIGSVPEIWLGIPNRGLSPEFINKFKLI